MESYILHIDTYFGTNTVSAALSSGGICVELYLFGCPCCEIRYYLVIRLGDERIPPLGGAPCYAPSFMGTFFGVIWDSWGNHFPGRDRKFRLSWHCALYPGAEAFVPFHTEK